MSTTAMNTTAAAPNWFSAQAKRLGVTDFWRWWVAELSASLAPLLARWAADDATMSEVVVGGEGIVLPGKVPRVIDATLDAAQRRNALESIWRDRGHDVAVKIEPAQLLVKRVRYPQATEENLRDVIAYDMDRQTPFTADQVVFDQRVVGRDAAHATLEVELALLPKAQLQTLLAPLKEAGAVIHSIGVAGDRGAPPLEFLPAAEKPARRLSRMQRIQLGMLALAVLLILLAVAVPILKKREAVVELNPQVVKAESEADVTRRVESEYQKFAQQYNFLTAKKLVQVPAIEIIEELTRLSPDSAWLVSMEIKTTPKAREVTLQGEAASASKMIEVLEQSPLLQNASPRAQITRGSQPNTERFNIVTEVKPRALPPMRPLVATDKAPVLPAVTAPAAPPAAAPAVAPAATRPAVVTPAAAPEKSAPPAAARPPAPIVPPPGAPPSVTPTKPQAGKAGAP